MELGLAGKKAIVTGGTRGIGRSIVERLSTEGCDVAFCARNREEVENVVQEGKELGFRRLGSTVDVTKAANLATWMEEAAAFLGGIDVLVPNVSALAVSNEEKSWIAGFDADVMGSVRAVEAALPHLEKSDCGSIVLIASTAALEVYLGPRPYNSMKAALVAYGKGLSRDLAPRGLRANIVSPGSIYFENGDRIESKYIFEDFGVRTERPTPFARSEHFCCLVRAQFIA